MFRSKYNEIKKKKPFLQQYSRRQRRSEVLKFKKMIKDNEKEFGGKFWSDTYVNSIDKSENKKTTRHWIDIFFLSKKDPSVLWNVEILTASEILNDHYSWKKRGKEVELFNIHEQFHIQKNYKYGVGLTIIVNESDLTQEVINKIIERFYDMGEIEWKDSNPVDKEKLINIYENIYKKNAEGGAILILD